MPKAELNPDSESMCLLGASVVGGSSAFNSDYANLLEPVTCAIKDMPIKRHLPFFFSKQLVTCSYLYCRNTFDDVGMCCQSVAGLAKASQTSVSLLQQCLLRFSLLLDGVEGGRNVPKY